MTINNKIPYLNVHFLNLLSSYSEDYLTIYSFQSLMFILLKPLLNRRVKSKVLEKLQWIAYKALSDIRSCGRRLVQNYSVSLFEKDFRHWLSLHKSNRSRNLLIAIADDTKSGRKYGFRIPELQYLYDYVKQCKYKTHKLYVLMISLGKYDYIVDFTFIKQEQSDSKIAFRMLEGFIKRLPKDLQADFRKEVRVALDGFYGKLKVVEDFIDGRGKDQSVKYSLVVKSGGTQLFKASDNKEYTLKELKEWMKTHLSFQELNPVHGFNCCVAKLEATSVFKNITMNIALFRFPSSKGDYRYLLLLTNRLDWHPYQILKTYACRWPIETMFRTVKQKLEMKNYSYHHKTGARNIEMHFSLRLILYMIINQYRIKHTRPSKTSLGDVIYSFETELSKLSDKQLLNLFAGKFYYKME